MSLLLQSCKVYTFKKTYHSKSITSIEFADNLVSQGKYDEAIAIYKKHMEARLDEKNKPELGKSLFLSFVYWRC